MIMLIAGPVIGAINTGPDDTIPSHSEVFMSTRNTLIVSGLLVLAGLAFSLSVYNRLPDPMASHWNFNDQVDGSMARFWGAFLMPVLSLGVLGLLMLVPRIDPLRANVAAFREPFNAFVTLLVAFFLYLHVLTLLWNLGYQNFRMSGALLPAVGLIFVFAGALMAKSKRNYFIGIRTPWTLSSDTVWDQTHRLGSRIFIGMGILVMILSLMGRGALVVLPFVILAAVLVPVIYSYILYRREAGA
jgi:uncharacterized membrane protein